MSAEWFKFIEYPVHGVSQVFQFVVIAFLTTEFLRKKSDLQQAFYYILYISYIADTAGNLAKKTELISVLFELNKYSLIFEVSNMVQWYGYKIAGILELMLAFNRCTALAFPAKHFKIWNGKPLYAIIIFIILFPFIVDGIPTVLNFNCRIHPFLLEECQHFNTSAYLSTAVSNITLTSVALFLVIFAVCKSANGAQSETVAKVERKMLLYTSLSTCLFILRFTCSLLHKHDGIIGIFYILSVLSYYLQHYLPMFLLPVINSIYRQAFLNFIGWKKFQNRGVVSVITSSQLNQRS